MTKKVMAATAVLVVAVAVLAAALTMGLGGTNSNANNGNNANENNNNRNNTVGDNNAANNAANNNGSGTGNTAKVTPAPMLSVTYPGPPNANGTYDRNTNYPFTFVIVGAPAGARLNITVLAENSRGLSHNCSQFTGIAWNDWYLWNITTAGIFAKSADYGNFTGNSTFTMQFWSPSKVTTLDGGWETVGGAFKFQFQLEVNGTPVGNMVTTPTWTFA